MDNLDWYKILEGTRKDKISWRNRQLPFDNKNNMKELAQKFKIDLGIGHKERNECRQIETTNEYSKSLTQKSIQDRRRGPHEKLLRSSAPND